MFTSKHYILAPSPTFLTSDVIDAANADLNDGFDVKALVAASIVSAEWCNEPVVELLFLKFSYNGI